MSHSYVKDPQGLVQARTVAVAAAQTVLAGPIDAEKYSALSFYLKNNSGTETVTFWVASTIDDAVLPAQDPFTTWEVAAGKSATDIIQTGGRQYIWLLASFPALGDDVELWVRGVNLR